jgi:hypothetical protein
MSIIREVELEEFANGYYAVQLQGVRRTQWARSPASAASRT